MFTLLEYAKGMGKGERSFIETFVSATDLLLAMPFRTIKGNSYSYNQEEILPGVGFRGINEGYSETTGVINPETERLVICGGDADVDKFLVDTEGPQRRVRDTGMKAKSMAHKIGHSLVKGDSTTNLKEFDGLQRRLVGAQVISNDASADGGALSLQKIDEAIDAVDSPTHLLMSKKMRRRLTQAARDLGLSGLLGDDRDHFGRKVTSYDGYPILLADQNGGSFVSLAADEAYTGGGTADGSSIYVLSIGEGMVSGIQHSPPDIRFLKELETKPTFRTRMEWYCGMVVEHPRAAARLRDIDSALAAVA